MKFYVDMIDYPNEKLDYLRHGWGTKPDQKKKEREYNHEYYIKNRDKLLSRAQKLRQNANKVTLHKVDYRMVAPENKRTYKDSINGVSKDELIDKEMSRLKKYYTDISNISNHANFTFDRSINQKESVYSKPNVPDDKALRIIAEKNVDEQIKEDNVRKNRQAQIAQGQAYNEYSKQYAMKRKREAENKDIQARKDRIEANAKWAENVARKWNLKAESTMQEIEKDRPLLEKATRFMEGHGEYMYDSIHNAKTNAIDENISNFVNLLLSFGKKKSK